MMHIMKVGFLAGALALGGAAGAVTVNPIGGNLLAFDYNVDGNIIEITEIWGPDTNRFVFLEFDGLVIGENYEVRKFAANLTGSAWGSFSHELGFGVGAGFLPSNDGDGLSFAQGSGLPRFSDRFSSILVDELGARDYLNFVVGSVQNNQIAVFGYGLRANVSDNLPFTLRQGVVPEPATWAMLILGFGLVGSALRRRTGVATA